jgi:hypothetical protein
MTATALLAPPAATPAAAGLDPLLLDPPGTVDARVPLDGLTRRNPNSQRVGLLCHGCYDDVPVPAGPPAGDRSRLYRCPCCERTERRNWHLYAA